MPDLFAETASPQSARRRVWQLAWPLILSNVTVPLLGLVDTAVMGHLPESEYLGAVTLGAMLFSFLYWGFGFLRMGTTGLTAQALGREDPDAVRLLLAQSLVTAAALGTVILLLHPWLISIGLDLMDGSAAVTAHADTYARIRVLSAPAVLGNYALIGWFLGLQNSRATLLLMVLNNSVNIVLDLLFVVGLKMTVDGVALASVIGDYLTLATGLGMAALTLNRMGGQLPWHRVRRWEDYRSLFRVNSALFVRTLCLLFAFAFFHAQGARQGDTILAANAVLMQFVLFTSFALDGFAHATEALVGGAIGQRSRQLFSRYVNAAALWSLVAAGGFSLAFLVGGKAIIAALTTLTAVRETAATYLGWAVAMPLVAVWSYLLDGIFIGATRTAAMRDSMLASVLLVYLPLWYLTLDYGNHGLWLAFIAMNTARSISLGLILRRDMRRGSWFATVGAGGASP
jgi:MATE family multidrug resistance protein